MMSGSMVDRPTFSIVNAETGEKIWFPGTAMSNVNGYYLSPQSARSAYYDDIWSAINDLATGYTLNGLDQRQREFSKILFGPIAVKNDVTGELTVKEDISSKVKTQIISRLLERELNIHPIITDDYIKGNSLDSTYSTSIIYHKDGSPPSDLMNHIENGYKIDLFRERIYIGDHNSIISTKFDNEDDAVLWKLELPFSVHSTSIRGVDKSIEKIKTVEEDFGISFKES